MSLSVTKTLTGLFNRMFFVACFEKGSKVAFSNYQMNETFFSEVCQLQMSIDWLLKDKFEYI